MGSIKKLLLDLNLWQNDPSFSIISLHCAKDNCSVIDLLHVVCLRVVSEVRDVQERTLQVIEHFLVAHQ